MSECPCLTVHILVKFMPCEKEESALSSFMKVSVASLRTKYPARTVRGRNMTVAIVRRLITSLISYEDIYFLVSTATWLIDTITHVERVLYEVGTDPREHIQA